MCTNNFISVILIINRYYTKHAIPNCTNCFFLNLKNGQPAVIFWQYGKKEWKVKIRKF